MKMKRLAKKEKIRKNEKMNRKMKKKFNKENEKHIRMLFCARDKRLKEIMSLRMC